MSHYKTMAMRDLTLLQEQYMSVAELFLWGEALDFTQWIQGNRERWKRTEYTLPRLVKWGYLRSVRHGRKMVYTASKRASTQHIDHGLACTQALLRFRESKDGIYVGEGFFRRHGFKAIPEWGIVYPNGTLLFEYLSADNFRRGKHLKHKIDRYCKEYGHFESVFERPFYVFVVEAGREEVKLLADKTGENFYLTDARSFFSIPKGEQLKSCIYIWGSDGAEYSL